MGTTTYRRTKHTRANGSVYYTYPNAASRRYYESKYRKTTTKKPTSSKPSTPKYGSDNTKSGSDHERPDLITSGTTKPVPRNLGQTIKEAREKGLAFVENKYGENLPADFKTKIQQIIANTTRTKKANFKAQASRFRDGGAAPADGIPFKRQMNFNLSNNSDLAQGSEHEWAQPTSISALISGQLRQAANSPVDLFETWAQDKVGTLTMANRTTPFGLDASFSFTPMEQLAQSNPMGAFGTNAVMEDYGAVQAEEAEDGDAEAGWSYADYVGENLHKTGYDNQSTYFMSEKGQLEYKTLGAEAFAEKYGMNINSGGTGFGGVGGTRYDYSIGTMGESYKPRFDPLTGKLKPVVTAPTNNVPVTDTGLPMYENPGGTPSDGSIFGEQPQTYYNPWSRLEGGATNQYGPSQQNLAQGQMEAMALANAYFAPQRMELAYELGDMETDMRRLAVNLGRQVDDPVLQAKLYKEASRATRTLDIQQNTFAFQMAESRRSQDISNWQFYDQLAAQEAQLKLANRQFYDKLEIDKRMYNLNNWAAQQNAAAQKTQPAPSSGEESQTYGNLLSPYKTF